MKTVFERETKYYKYVYSTWTQPTLTSDGSFGGDSIGTAISFGSNNYKWGTAYQVFAPNTGNCGLWCDEYQSWVAIDIYIPKVLKITSIQIGCFTTGDGADGNAYNTVLYAGNSKGSTAVTLKNIGTVNIGGTTTFTIDNAGYYQYFRLYFTNGGYAYEDKVCVGNIKIFGTARDVTEGTASDYDYKIESGKTYMIHENNTYKAFNI